MRPFLNYRYRLNRWTTTNSCANCHNRLWRCSQWMYPNSKKVGVVKRKRANHFPLHYNYPLNGMSVRQKKKIYTKCFCGRVNKSLAQHSQHVLNETKQQFRQIYHSSILSSCLDVGRWHRSGIRIWRVFRGFNALPLSSSSACFTILLINSSSSASTQPGSVAARVGLN